MTIRKTVKIEQAHVEKDFNIIIDSSSDSEPAIFEQEKVQFRIIRQELKKTPRVKHSFLALSKIPL